MDNTSLIVLKKGMEITTFFSGEKGGLDFLLNEIREKATAEKHTVETKKGRAAIASMAYKVARSKTLLDKAGQSLVAEWKNKAKKVDAERKRARDALDKLRDEIRQPLTDWEIAEKERAEKEEKLQAFLKDWDDAIAEHKLYLRSKEIEKKEALLAAAEAKRLAAEQERIEAETKKKREEQLKKEAAEKAKREAEAKAKKEQDRLEQSIREERAKRDLAEKEKKIAEERAKIEKQVAIDEANRKAAEKIKAVEEQIRLQKIEEEKKRAEKEAAEKAKREKKSHIKKINRAVYEGFIANGLSDKEALKITTLLSKNKIPYVSINY